MPIVTLPGGELRDEIREIVYDTINLNQFSTVAGTREFFSSLQTVNALGGTQNKTTDLTNLPQPGRLETATSYRNQGFSFEALNTLNANSALLPVFIQKSSLTMIVGQKIYWQGPSRFAAGRMIMSGIAGTDFATGQIQQQFGWPAISALVFTGKHVIDINPLQSFKVVWDTQAQDLTAAEAALTVSAGSLMPFQLCFKGLLRRPVQ